MNVTSSRKTYSWIALAAPKISVVILGHASAPLLQKCIDSFLLWNPIADWEMILVLNGAHTSVRCLAESYLDQNAFPLLVLTAENSNPGAARNFGVGVVRGEILLFLDDDIECYQDLVGYLAKLFTNSNVAAAGGPNFTPPGSGFLEKLGGYALGSFFGAFFMSARYCRQDEGLATEHQLILCNLAVRKNLFEGQGGFKRTLVSNEENLLLQKLQGQGRILWASNKLGVFHRRRGTWRGIGRQSLKYGQGRAQNIFAFPQSLRWYYFLPMFFLIYLLSLPLGLFLLGGVYLLPFCAYLLLAFIAGLWLFFVNHDPASLMLPMMYFWVHACYGLGFLRGVTEKVINKSLTIKIGGVFGISNAKR